MPASSSDDDKDHKFGLSLVARDNPGNRKLFPDGPFGYVPVAKSVCTEDGECPHYHHTEDATHDAALETPIHVLIASFRDRLCGRTLHNAFTRAENPKRLFIRVLDQTQRGSDLEDDEGCWERYCSVYNKDCEEFKDQVQTVKVDATKSKGPTYARSKLSAMINWDYQHRDEPNDLLLEPVQMQDFCMQIDSHMDFSDNFDTGLIMMQHRTQNDYAVLSTYVTEMEQNNKDLHVMPNLCMVTFTSSIRNWATKECRHIVKPKLTNAMWGAGLSFHRCHGEINVPVDSYLDNVFDGEEGSRGIRFFTHGYDVYTPDKVLVTHDYHGHQNNPVVHTWGRGHRKGQAEEEEDEKFKDNWKWNSEIDKARENLYVFGSKRVNMLLGIGSKFDSTAKERKELGLIRNSIFGLGTKRSMEQVRNFTGIDLLNERMVENKCGNLIWVPYDESPDYGVDQTLARSYAGEKGNDVPNLLEPPPPPPGVVLDQHHRDFRPIQQQNEEKQKQEQPLIGNNAAKENIPRLRAAAEIPAPLSTGDGHNHLGYQLLLGGLVVAVLLIIRLSARRFQRKDDRHRN